jgi:hypothetical protein
MTRLFFFFILVMALSFNAFADTDKLNVNIPQNDADAAALAKESAQVDGVAVNYYKSRGLNDGMDAGADYKKCMDDCYFVKRSKDLTCQVTCRENYMPKADAETTKSSNGAIVNKGTCYKQVDSVNNRKNGDGTIQRLNDPNSPGGMDGSVACNGGNYNAGALTAPRHIGFDTSDKAAASTTPNIQNTKSADDAARAKSALSQLPQP